MAIANGYTTLDDFKRWATGLEPGVPDDLDPLIETAIESTSRWIDGMCRRHFFQIEESRVFEAEDSYNVRLGHFNDLTNVTTVEVATDEDGDGVFETTWGSTDFELRPRNALAGPEPKPYRCVRAIGRTFPINRSPGGRLERVRITGTWGWPSVPTAIEQATKIQVHRIVKRREAPEGIVGLNQFGVMYVSGQADPDVAKLIGRYRLKAVA